MDYKITRNIEYQDVEKKNNEEELMHYGVQGMKWGVRKDLRKDFKTDRRKGRQLTVNAGFAREAYVQAIKKRQKNSNSDSIKKEKLWKNQYNKEIDVLKNHVKSMTKKYGPQHVKDITYRDTKIGKNHVVKLMKDTEISDDVRKITRSTTFLFGPIIGSAAGNSLQLAEYKDYVNKIEKTR